LSAESSSDGENEEEEDKTIHSWRARVVVGIAETENDGQENSGSSEFGEERGYVGHVWLSSSEEEGSCAGRFAESSDTGSTFELVDKILIVGLDEDGSDHSTEKLSKEVSRYFAPGETTEDGERSGDSGREMGTRYTTSNVDTEHNTGSPSVRDGEVASLRQVGKNDLAVHTVSEDNENHRSQELAKVFLVAVAESCNGVGQNEWSFFGLKAGFDKLSGRVLVADV